MDLTHLIDKGFAPDTKLKASMEQAAKRLGMNDSGPYVVHGMFRKGAVVLKVEQNTAVEPNGLTITYPPVCIITGPRGSVTVSADDTDLILQVANDLS